MAARKEITKRYAQKYRGATKKEKGRLLDELVGVTGWSRANARRRIAEAGQRRGPRRKVKPKPRTPVYGYDTLKVLQRVWVLMGMPSGKYLAATMSDTVAQLDRFAELDGPRYTPLVREQLLAVSAATIDRMLAPTKRSMAGRGISTTKPGTMLRSSIPIRRAGQEWEGRPGFCEVDLVAHCGPSARGEYVHTVNLVDVHTSWTEPVAIRNRAHRWVLTAIKQIRDRMPFDLLGLDFDNGGEFVNHTLVGWAQDEDIYLTRARPYKSNDNAHIEQKNGDVVRRLAFHYRYDTEQELDLLNDLYDQVRLRFNLFTATKKAVGWNEGPTGRHTRVYDQPRTPYHRVLDSGVLTTEQAEELTALREATNPAALTRRITRIQNQLIKLAGAKTQAATRAEIVEAREPISRAS